MMYAITKHILILLHQLLILPEPVFQMYAQELNQEKVLFIHHKLAQEEEALIQTAAINFMMEYWEQVAIISFH